MCEVNIFNIEDHVEQEDSSPIKTSQGQNETHHITWAEDSRLNQKNESQFINQGNLFNIHQGDSHKMNHINKYDIMSGSMSGINYNSNYKNHNNDTIGTSSDKLKLLETLSSVANSQNKPIQEDKSIDLSKIWRSFDKVRLNSLLLLLIFF